MVGIWKSTNVLHHTHRQKKKRKEKVYYYLNRGRRIISQDSKLIIKNFSKVGLEANNPQYDKIYLWKKIAPNIKLHDENLLYPKVIDLIKLLKIFYMPCDINDCHLQLTWT